MDSIVIVISVTVRSAIQFCSLKDYSSIQNEQSSFFSSFFLFIINVFEFPYYYYCSCIITHLKVKIA